MTRSEQKGRPVLLVIDGEMRGHQWVMYGESLVIGRGGECEVVIPDSRVSREHLRVYEQEGSFFVEDLDSKNGSHLNGQPLTGARPLREGDEIQVALAVKLKFSGSEATVPLTMEDQAQSKDPGAPGLSLDEHTRQVYVNGMLLDPQLSLSQYRLLSLLFQRAGGICTREEVVRAVWPDAVEEGVSEQAIDALVRRLRDRLGEIDPDQQFIITVRGHGFRLDK